MKIRTLAFLAFLPALSNCKVLPQYQYTECEKWSMTASCRAPVPVEVYKPEQFANEEGTISLQNLTSRVIVHCYTTENMDAETCAQAFEKENFVRFREIPYRTADYDFLKKDTYPTRRWRNGERAPRW